MGLRRSPNKVSHFCSRVVVVVVTLSLVVLPLTIVAISLLLLEWSLIVGAMRNNALRDATKA